MASEIKLFKFSSHEHAKVQHGEKEWKFTSAGRDLIFTQLHHSENRCIYAYKFDAFVRASECSVKVFPKDSVKLAQNAEIFKPVKYTDKYKRLYRTVEMLLFNTDVVPLQPMLDVVKEIKTNISLEETQDVTLEHHQLSLECHKLTLERLETTLHRLSQKTTVELQLNSWFYDSILAMLERDFNLVVHAHSAYHSLPETLICVYGKSQPDLCFHPMYASGDKVALTGGIIMPIDVDHDPELDKVIVGGLAEFKPFSERCVPQIFANLIRYAVFISEERLKRGYLIQRIQVLGILASHHKGMCIPVKLNADLINGSTSFMEGEAMSFADGFVGLVYNTISWCG